METLASRALDDWNHFKKTYVSSAVLNGHWDLAIDDLFSGCYGFQIFNKSFCEQFIEEAEKNNSWGGIQGDAVPGPDLLLENFGFNDFYNKVLKELVHPAIIYKYHLEEVMEGTPDEERF